MKRLITRPLNDMFGFNNFGDIIQFSSGCDMTFSETATVQAEKWKCDQVNTLLPSEMFKIKLPYHTILPLSGFMTNKQYLQ